MTHESMPANVGSNDQLGHAPGGETFVAWYKANEAYLVTQPFINYVAAAAWKAAQAAEQKKWSDAVAGVARAAADNNDLRVYELMRGLNDALYRA